MVDLYLSDGTLNEEQTSLIELATPSLREIIARVLSHPETGVFPAGEVSVETHYLDTLRPGQKPEEHIDYMECDVQVKVTSNKYPWRMEHKDELAAAIMEAWSVHLPSGVTAWLWLNLVDAGFAKRKFGLEDRPLGD